MFLSCLLSSRLQKWQTLLNDDRKLAEKPMIGTILNGLGILLGGVLGLLSKRQMSHSTQANIKNILGILTVFVGLKMTFTSLGGGFGNVLLQLVVVVVALTIGRLLGRLMRLQKFLNFLAKIAQQKLSKASPQNPDKFNEGFLTCTILFCVGPMSLLGAIQDGVSGQWQVLGVKAIMDGLATMAFVTTFGWGAILSVVPVIAYQGTISLLAKFLIPALESNALLDSVNATGGMLVFSLALLILEIRRIEVSDYLPSLVVAPLLTWWWW